MAPHYSTLAWKIPWMEEPGRLQAMGSLRVGNDGATSLSLFTFLHWRRKWQRTPVFLPGESQGRGSLVGCHLWGCTESDMTEATGQQKQQQLRLYLIKFSISLSSQSVQFNSVTQLCPTLSDPTDFSSQPSLSINNSKSLLKLMSIESAMPSNHLILSCSLLHPPSIFTSIRGFSNESALRIRWQKYWNFSISPFNDYSGLISFTMDWLDLLAVQVTQESSPTPQFKSINSSVLSFLYSPNLTSIHDNWKNHCFD